MKFLLRHFYNISVFIALIIIIITIIFWSDFSILQRIALLNLAVINLHFFEEFGYPGGFPKFANTMMLTKNSPRPDRYPLNQVTAFVTNWGTALVLYVPPIFFPNTIWLGLAPILFGGAFQFIAHAIITNKILNSYYNAGLATVIFGHLPLMIIYLYYIHSHGLVSLLDYIIAIMILVFWYGVVIRIFVSKGFENINSPYAFSNKEMAKFKK